MVEKQIKAVFNWSGGKDSALALYKVLQENKYEVVALLTTVNEENQRSSITLFPFLYCKNKPEVLEFLYTRLNWLLMGAWQITTQR